MGNDTVVDDEYLAKVEAWAGKLLDVSPTTALRLVTEIRRLQLAIKQLKENE